MNRPLSPVRLCWLKQSIAYGLGLGLLQRALAAGSQPQARHFVRTRHHDEPYYVLATAEEALRPAPVIGHSDAELMLLENLVGRWPPL